jgi:hypothetical protein
MRAEKSIRTNIKRVFVVRDYKNGGIDEKKTGI